jgi:hypothetical protein
VRCGHPDGRAESRTARRGACRSGQDRSRAHDSSAI